MQPDSELTYPSLEQLITPLEQNEIPSGTVTETKWKKVRMDDLQELPNGEK